MNRKFLIAVLFLCTMRVQAQQVTTAKRTVEPYNMEVSYKKTTHIIFPASVRYVDLGSTDLIAGKAEGAENVVRVKAAKERFDGETNFSVITSDGCFYTFDVRYSDNPRLLNIEIENSLMENPFSSQSDKQNFIRLPELGDETPLAVNRIAYTIRERNVEDIKTVGCRKYGIQTLLKGIYIYNDLLFFHITLINDSPVSFEPSLNRFRLMEKRVMKRTAIQETLVEPVLVYPQPEKIATGSSESIVFVFRKFTIPQDKVLEIEITEKEGSRHQRFTVRNIDLQNIRNVQTFIQ